MMGDIGRVEEGKNGAGLGFDYIGRGLHGYTSYREGELVYENELEFVKDVVESVDGKVIGEGNVIRGDMYKGVMELGVDC